MSCRSNGLARVLLNLRGGNDDVRLADVAALGECNHVLVHGRLHRGHLQAVEGRLSFVLIGAGADGVDDQTVNVHAQHEGEVAVDDGGSAVVQEDRSGVGALVAQHVDLGLGECIQLGRGVAQSRDLGQVEALVPDGALGIDSGVEAGDRADDALHVVAGIGVGHDGQIGSDGVGRPLNGGEMSICSRKMG